MSEQVQRKLVGAARYMSPLLGDKLVERNEVVTVSAEVAAKLDEDTYVNPLGEVKKYFAKVKDDSVEEVEDDEEDTDAGTTPKRTPRTRATKAAKAQKADGTEGDAGVEEDGSDD
jgi:hypothetical protein